MKNYKAILIVSLALVVLIVFIGSKVISDLKEQNNALLANIDLITRRITILELDKTMEQISALKVKNIALKREIDNLKAELSKISQKVSASSRQDTKRRPGSRKGTAGNKGFLTKENKPTQ